MEDLHALALSTLRDLLWRRQISCAELAESAIAAVERANPRLNAIIRFDPDFIRHQARAADARLMAGERGPWLGIPVTVKDNLWIKDRPVSNGSMLYRDFTAPEDALAVGRMRAAGAVLLGSTNCSEFACKGVTTNPLHGPTRNPWRTDLTPGGSSGGAAAATAAGLGHLALATDAGGSVRRPAAHCGVVGMKPTAGMIPHPVGFAEPVYGNSVVGLMARRVADIGDALAALAGPDAADPQSPPPWATPDLVAIKTPLRVAVSPRLGLGFAVDPDISAAVQRSAQALADAGHSVDHADPDWPEGTSEEALMPLQLAGLAAIYGDRFKAGAWEADPDIARQIEAGLTLSGRAVAEALELRKAMYQALHALHQRHDALLTPTTAATAWPLDRLGPEQIEGRPASARAHAVFTPIFNHCYGAACSVPVGLDRLGLPIGVQIAGPMFSDARVLALAAALETASAHDFSKPRQDYLS